MPERRDQVGAIDNTELLSRPMSRRLFLGATIGAAMSMIDTQSLHADDWSDWINKVLKNIPMNTPFLAKKNTMLTSTPAHGLIVIRQMHWGKDLNSIGLSNTKACQEEIRSMLEFLLTYKWIDDVYDEGLTPEREPHHLYKKIDFRNPPAEYRGAMKNIPDLTRFGAAHNLYAHRYFLLKAGEKTKPYVESEAYMYTDSSDADYQQKVFEDRENALLEIISESKDHLACTVYGAAHEWTNNVLEWNRAHPDDTFSLVTLTPRAVDVVYDKNQSLPLEHPPLIAGQRM